MSDVKRYDQVDSSMFKSAAGDWVYYTDYAALRAENQRLVENTIWYCPDCDVIQPFSYVTFACCKCKVTGVLHPYHEYRRKRAEAENQMLREAAQEALHYLECHADIDDQLFCTRRLRAALAENPIAHEQERNDG